MDKLIQKIYRVQSSFKESRQTLIWIWHDLLGDIGRKRGVRSVLLLIASTLTLLCGTYVTKEVIDALANNERSLAVYWIIIGDGIIHLVARIIMAYHAYERELAWNDNHLRVRTHLDALFFNRTMGELSSEENVIGPEQIILAQVRVDNLLHLLLFNVAPAAVTIVASIILTATIDFTVTLFMLSILSFNLLWFLYFNEVTAVKLKPVEKGFRQVNNRMGELWHQFQTTKNSGVEDKVCSTTASELEDMLRADKAIWADWFIWLDVRRSLLNILSLVLIMFYGVQYSAWSPGEFAAMAIWIGMTAERFSTIGMLMRNFSEDISRLHIVRTTLTKTPLFNRSVGSIYIPKGALDAHKAK